MNIRFNYSEVQFRMRASAKHKAWLLSFIEAENYRVGFIQYVFVSPDEIMAINKRFLNHNYATDVIAFDYSASGVVSGEIYICPPVIKENSKKYSVSFTEEIRRVLVHAVLHLMGYTDSDKKAQSIMRNREDEILNIYRNDFQV